MFLFVKIGSGTAIKFIVYSHTNNPVANAAPNNFFSNAASLYTALYKVYVP